MEKFDSVGTTMAKTASDSRPIPWRTAPRPPFASPPKQVTEININPCHGPGDHRGFEHGVCGCGSNCGTSLSLSSWRFLSCANRMLVIIQFPAFCRHILFAEGESTCLEIP